MHALLRAGASPADGFVLITSRASFEMVEKVAGFGARPRAKEGFFPGIVAGRRAGGEVDAAGMDVRGGTGRRTGDGDVAGFGFEEVRVRRGQDGETIEDHPARHGETRAPEDHP